MNTALLKSCLLGAGILVSANAQSEIHYPTFEGPLMGQKAPGKIAEPFAPGVISTNKWEVEGVFSPDMNEFYYTRKIDKVITVVGFRKSNNVWQQYTQFKRRGEVTFSPDGNRMYMANGYKDRDGDGWSARKSLGPQIDRKDWGIMRLSASSNQTYVFDDYKGGDVIRISNLVNGVRQTPVKMPKHINSGKWTAHPFIAPDESYLIWDSERSDGFGDSDLYISFKQNDGTWGKAINMGDTVNSDKWDAYATVSSDGKYLMFNRGVGEDNNDIYWVDASIIETLRAKQ
ncbi:TolB-like translocation protein [Pseudoalteromonas piratica]|uniref:Uncharacterized protein n=1 Tax=Pseudoalteromonas piratica TaxID=1348114 RepID=A0A0A7EJB8_9GAMM|nr:PD40 domain-containing protein [Pseudoalteromonas piratica]AIY66739.1 hypothetical protein OM33_16575 [Pseudoalteromonas piratica]